MSAGRVFISDIVGERRDAIDLLRRVVAGDSAAIPDSQGFLDGIDKREREANEAHAAAEARRLARKRKSPLHKLSRSFNGVAWGKAPYAIARRSDGLLLIWVPGSTGYVDRVAGRRYSSSELRIVTDGDMHKRSGVILHEGGRLSKKLIQRYTKEIDTAFGAVVAERITLKETLEVSS